jgi:RNA polymerase sigma-70 factor (ECF subfamily)
MLKFKDLYSKYAHDIYRFAFWLSGNSEDAKDITSETFVRAWMNLSSIRTETLKGYLLKIARNVYLGQLRDVRSELARIQIFLKTLPEIDRSAFVIRIKYELPYAEIARILQISEAAARVKVHRVRKKLIENRMDEEAT